MWKSSAKLKQTAAGCLDDCQVKSKSSSDCQQRNSSGTPRHTLMLIGTLKRLAQVKVSWSTSAINPHCLLLTFYSALPTPHFSLFTAKNSVTTVHSYYSFLTLHSALLRPPHFAHSTIHCSSLTITAHSSLITPLLCLLIHSSLHHTLHC